MRRLIYISLISFFLFSCKKENNCFIGAGKNNTETIELDTFSKIEISHFLNVNWKKSSDYKIEINGGENFTSNVTPTITNNILELTNDNGCKVLRAKTNDIIVTVFCPSINSLTLRGSGEVNFLDTIKNNITINSIANQGTINGVFKNDFTKFYLESGSADINISGTSRYCDYYNAAIIHFYGKSFEVDSFRLHSKANGITEINATKWLHVEQNGAGDIHYWGNPDFFEITSYLGSGLIIKE